tara:strand:- start:415 stop:1512 length:1098 start_codon:yes stop_codon:yes gene_type:complete
MQKIKICYTISSLNKEGPVNVLLNIISNMNFSKFDIHIITLNPEKQNSIINDFSKLSLTIHQLNLKEKCLFPPVIAYTKAIKKISPDIVHSHCLRSLMLNFIFSRDRSVHTVHIYPGIQTIKKKGFLLGSILAFLNKLFTKAIKYPVACSKSIANMFSESDNFEMKYIQNGVNNEIIKNVQKNQLKLELGLDQGKTYFVTAGRFSPEKNFQFLIESFNKLNKQNVGLIILGEGALFNELENLKNDNIIFTGFVDDIKAYLNASDYYVSSSITEGLPMSVLEALSVGLPLLLSNIPSHIEILSKDNIGRAGYIYENNNPDSFFKSFDNLISNDYSSTKTFCYLLYRNNFTSKIMSNKYEQFYLKII